MVDYPWVRLFMVGCLAERLGLESAIQCLKHYGKVFWRCGVTNGVLVVAERI